MITADGSSASGLLLFTRHFIMGKPPSLDCRLVVCFIETVLSIKLTLFSKPESTKVLATEKRRNVDDDKKPNKAQEADEPSAFFINELRNPYNCEELFINE